MQFALKIVAAVILHLAEVYDRLADRAEIRSNMLFGQAERRIHHARSRGYPWLARNQLVIE